MPKTSTPALCFAVLLLTACSPTPEDTTTPLTSAEVQPVAERYADLVATNYADAYDDGPGARPWTDFDQSGAGTAANQDRRGTYLMAAAELLVTDLASLVDAWDAAASNNYRAAFVAATPDDIVRRMMLGIGSLSGAELAGERIEVALDTRDQEDEHSCFSDNTHRDIVNNAVGIQNVYLGRYPSAEAGPSLYDLVASRDTELADRLRDEIQASVDAANMIPEPFDRAIVDQRETVEAVVDALRTQPTRSPKSPRYSTSPWLWNDPRPHTRLASGLHAAVRVGLRRRACARARARRRAGWRRDHGLRDRRARVHALGAQPRCRARDRLFRRQLLLQQELGDHTVVELYRGQPHDLTGESPLPGGTALQRFVREVDARLGRVDNAALIDDGAIEQALEAALATSGDDQKLALIDVLSSLRAVALLDVRARLAGVADALPDPLRDPSLHHAEWDMAWCVWDGAFHELALAASDNWEPLIVDAFESGSAGIIGPEARWAPDEFAVKPAKQIIEKGSFGVVARNLLLLAEQAAGGDAFAAREALGLFAMLEDRVAGRNTPAIEIIMTMLSGDPAAIDPRRGHNRRCRSSDRRQRDPAHVELRIPDRARHRRVHRQHRRELAAQSAKTAPMAPTSPGLTQTLR